MILENNDQNQIAEFIQLFNDQENRTHIWSAVHSLEKLNIDKKNERVALEIIETEAKGNSGTTLGFQYWLDDYKAKR